MVSRVKAGKGSTLEEDEDPCCRWLGRKSRSCRNAVGQRSLADLCADEMKEMPRGRGVTMMGLDSGEKLQSVGLTDGRKVIVHGTNKGGKAVSVEITGEALAKHLLHRARKGSLIGSKMKTIRLETKKTNANE
jgi:topoisomerase-4 subunit A